MKKIVFILCVLISLISCKKNNIENPDIHIELMDDVSPVLVKFFVDNKWERYEWKFNDYYYPSNPARNEVYFTFPPDSLSKVSLKVYNGDDFITVEKEFITPPLPRKLKFYGMVVNKDLMFLADCDKYCAVFGFYKENELITKYDSAFIKAPSHNVGDTLLFMTPIEYDISNYILSESFNNIYIWIDGCQYNTNIFFGESGSIRNSFIMRNQYDPKNFRVASRQDLIPCENLDLLVDWIP